MSVEDAQAFAAENGLFYTETSAKTASNVTELFTDIARRLPKVEVAPRPAQPNLVLDAPQAAPPRKSACC